MKRMFFLAALIAISTAFSGTAALAATAGKAGNVGVEIGQLAPEFTLQNKKGEWVSLSDFRGKKVFLYSWATWCECREQLPALEAFYKKHKSDKFEVITVASDSEGFKWVQKYLDNAKATYTALVDPEHQLATKYNFLATQNGFLIDEGGAIRMSVIGFDIRKADQREELEKLMKTNFNPAPKSAKGKAIDEKIKDIEAGLAEKPGATGKRIELAELYRIKGAYDKAEAELRKAVEQKPKSAEAHFKLGVVLYHQGNIDEAVKEWEKAYKYESTNYMYMRTLEAHKTPEKFYSEIMK